MKGHGTVTDLWEQWRTSFCFGQEQGRLCYQSLKIMPQTQTPRRPRQTPETAACYTNSPTESRRGGAPDPAAAAAGMDMPLPLRLSSPIQSPDPSDGLGLDHQPVPIGEGAGKANLFRFCCGRWAAPPSEMQSVADLQAGRRP